MLHGTIQCKLSLYAQQTLYVPVSISHSSRQPCLERLSEHPIAVGLNFAESTNFFVRQILHSCCHYSSAMRKCISLSSLTSLLDIEYINKSVANKLVFIDYSILFIKSQLVVNVSQSDDLF